MDWFRRKLNQDKPVRRYGVRVDIESYNDEIGEGTLPGLLIDGRYWVMMADLDGRDARIHWELQTTYQSAKSWLKVFRSHCDGKPQRLNQASLDDIDGIWVGRQRRETVWVSPESKGTLALLGIWHPDQIGALKRYRVARSDLGLNDLGE